MTIALTLLLPRQNPKLLSTKCTPVALGEWKRNRDETLKQRWTKLTTARHELAAGERRPASCV